MTRTLLLAVLFVAYVAVFVRVPALRSAFDPLDRRPHRVETLIVANELAKALPLAMELRRNHPAEPEVAFWVATIQRGLGRTQKEAEAWEEYARLSPLPVDACPAWPDAYARLGQHDRALSTYERCATLDPGDPALLSDLADAYDRAGRGHDAVDAYRRAAALDPDNPALQTRLARLGEVAR